MKTKKIGFTMVAMCFIISSFFGMGSMNWCHAFFLGFFFFIWSQIVRFGSNNVKGATKTNKRSIAAGKSTSFGHAFRSHFKPFSLCHRKLFFSSSIRPFFHTYLKCLSNTLRQRIGLHFFHLCFYYFETLSFLFLSSSSRSISLLETLEHCLALALAY